MGVTGLFKFLKDKFGEEIYEYIHISHFSYKIIYFDISSYIFSYIKIYGNNTNNWLNAFVKLFMQFKQYKIHMIPVFDGKSPAEKYEERNDRKLQAEKSDEKCMNISVDLQCYKNTGEATQLLKDIMCLIKNKEPKFLSKEGKNVQIDIQMLEDYLEKKEVGLTDITKNDVDKLKDLLKNLGVPFLQAKDEAETLCNDLVKRGLGYATFSLDSDCVAYDVPIFINDFDTKKEIFRVVKMQNLYEITGLTSKQMRDLCILCGVDYNRHTKPKNGIGPVSAYKHLKEFGDFKQIMKNKNILEEGYRYERCNELFTLTYPENNDIYVWETIEPKNIIDYLKHQHLYCDISKINEYWAPVKLLFIDE
jgi:5'-3' exonuclease